MSARSNVRSDLPWFGVARPDLGWVPSLRYLSRRRELLGLVRFWPKGARVAEFGCGAGAFLHDLSDLGFDVTGVETSDDARVLAISLRDAEAGTWPIHDDVRLLDGSFDVIAAFDVLEHIEDDIAALKKWRERVLPGGLLCISVPAHRRWWGPGDVWAGHFRRYDRQELHQRLRDSGWAVDRIVPYGFPIASSTELLGRPYYARALARGGSISLEGATARSGIDRRPYVSFWPVLGSRVGGWAVRAMLALQSAPWPERWGAGYIAIARADG